MRSKADMWVFRTGEDGRHSTQRGRARVTFKAQWRPAQKKAPHPAGLSALASFRYAPWCVSEPSEGVPD
jgi:hypothetical protein